MKKDRIIFCVNFFLVMNLFLSCSIFSGGNDFVDKLNQDLLHSVSDYSTVTIVVDSESTKSIIPVAGKYEQKYKITDEINLIFEPNPEYSLKEWSFVPEGSVEIIEGNANSANIIAKIKQTADITIKPVCVRAEHLQITFKSDYANISPSVPKEYVIGDTFNLECREESDYYFLRWQVFLTEDATTELKDFSDFLEFENENQGINNPSTLVNVKGTGKDITISPLLVKRPKVVNSSPVYDSNGSFRDSKIVVMFDEEMDDSSIYYSEEEIQQLKEMKYIVLENKNIGKCYGYKDEKGEIHYKNISINHYSEGSENYLKYYNAPFFDENNKHVLRISVNRSLLPPSSTDIIVKINKDFNFCDKNSKKIITMNSDYSYSFRTSSSLDNELPYIGKYDDSEDDVVVKIIPEEEVKNDNLEYCKNWNSLTDNLNMSKSDFIENYYDISQKLWIHCRISDGDSGIKKVECTLSQVEHSFNGEWVGTDDNFKPCTIIIDTISEDFGTEKLIDLPIDLSEIFKKTYNERVYKCVLSVTDYAGNVTFYKNLYLYYETSLFY